jgi:hypothetical protein
MAIVIRTRRTGAKHVMFLAGADFIRIYMK